MDDATRTTVELAIYATRSFLTSLPYLAPELIANRAAGVQQKVDRAIKALEGTK